MRARWTASSVFAMIAIGIYYCQSLSNAKRLTLRTGAFPKKSVAICHDFVAVL
jgi:hypothetical protein